MKRSIRSIVALVALGLLGAYAIAQAAAPEGSAGHGAHQPGGSAGQPGMHSGPMGGDMKGMMAKMPPEMVMRCQMLMNTAVSPGDPAAVLALKDQLKLTEGQATQLQAINKEARDKGVAVLTADQKKTLDALPKSPQTMEDMHEQMMGQMQKVMGDKPMSCPMMRMMQGQMGPTTQPRTAAPAAAADQDHPAHH